MKMSRWFLMCLSALTFLCAACGGSTTPVATSVTPKATNVTLKLDDSSVSGMALATQKGDFHTPLDSTPDASGKIIYFTASSAKGSGVFQVAADGGSAKEVFVGSPFVAARGIAIDPDGKVLYIADPNADQIFTLSVTGGTPIPLSGSKGTMPQNLNVATYHGQQVVYFTGKDAISGQAAVFTLPAKGEASATVIAKGAPLVAPDGVVITKTGVVYVSDRAASSTNEGKIFKIASGTVTAIVNSVHLGNPAGIALSPDDSILLASSFQLNSTHD